MLLLTVLSTFTVNRVKEVIPDEYGVEEELTVVRPGESKLSASSFR